MNLATNKTSPVTPIAFSELSNSQNNFAGGFSVPLPGNGGGAVTVLVVTQTPTITARRVDIGIDVTPATGDVILRKYFVAGLAFVDEVVGNWVAPGQFQFSSVLIMETCELYLRNTDAVAGVGSAEIICRS